MHINHRKWNTFESLAPKLSDLLGRQRARPACFTCFHLDCKQQLLEKSAEKQEVNKNVPKMLKFGRFHLIRVILAFVFVILLVAIIANNRQGGIHKPF